MNDLHSWRNSFKMTLQHWGKGHFPVQSSSSASFYGTSSVKCSTKDKTGTILNNKIKKYKPQSILWIHCFHIFSANSYILFLSANCVKHNEAYKTHTFLTASKVPSKCSYIQECWTPHMSWCGVSTKSCSSGGQKSFKQKQTCDQTKYWRGLHYNLFFRNHRKNSFLKQENETHFPKKEAETSSTRPRQHMMQTISCAAAGGAAPLAPAPITSTPHTLNHFRLLFVGTIFLFTALWQT